MGRFYGLRLQGVAQSVRHDLRIAKIAHEKHLFIGEWKRSEPALPTHSPTARARRS
jgi:hypothetical protein